MLKKIEQRGAWPVITAIAAGLIILAASYFAIELAGLAHWVWRAGA